MTNLERLERYKVFIDILTNELQKMFENQREFIKCREGCSYCCEYGEYPFSEAEFEYLLEGYEELDNDIKNQIISNAKTEERNRNNSGTTPFMYKCPFLIDKRCSVYTHRGIVCRTFGLLAEHTDGSYTIPFCHEKGLNYSNVYDSDLGQIVMEKAGKTLSLTEPKAYRITRESVFNLSIAKKLNLDFGESKTLLNMFLEYLGNN